MSLQYSEFKVSVIIPIYNLEKYLHKAIDSIIGQMYVGEIIIAEDGSSDNTWTIAKEYAEKYPELIRIVTHENRENKGLGASRNLGVKEAKYEYIAFLDGDDYYLPDRFLQTKITFEKNENADGIYEVLGTDFTHSEGKKLFSQAVAKGQDLDDEYLTRINGNFHPDELFKALAYKSHGCFHTNTLTLKKGIFKKSGYFKENLRLHGDNEAFLRFAYYGRLIPSGKDKPVAIRVVHETNRMTTERDKLKRHLFNKEVFMSFYKTDIPNSIKLMFFKNYLFGHVFRSSKNSLFKSFTTVIILLFLLIRYPKIIPAWLKNWLQL